MSATGNPLLDNPTLKATLAAQMAQQNAPPPPAITMPAGGAAASPSILSGMPSMPSTPQPPVGAPRGTVAGDTNKLSSDQRKGSGISQIHSKIEDSGFGQKHPVLSKVLGIGAQGLAELGDIGLSTFGGGFGRLAAQKIPGTEEHHDIQVRQDQRQLAETVANQKGEAQTGEAQALAGEAGARENAIENPEPKPGKEETWKTLLGGNGQMVTAPNGKIVQESSLGNLRYGVLPEGATVGPKAATGGNSAFDQWSTNPQKYEDFQKALAETKAQVAAEHPKQAANSSFMNLYAAQRFLQMAYSHNPALLPVASQMIAKLLNLTPEQQATMGTVPENQPLSPETGHPIGTSMPEAPTGPTRAQAQQAQRFLEEYPRISQDVNTSANDLGPVKGREVMGFLLGSVGSTGSPEADQRLSKLRTDLSFVASNAAKFHINSVRQAEHFDQLVAANKSPAPAIQGFLDAVKDWASTAQKQEQGYGEGAGSKEGQRPAGVPANYVHKDGPKGVGWYAPTAK